MPREAKTPQPLVYMIIGTMCTVLLLNIGCTVYLAIRGVEPVSIVFSLLKDVTLLVLGHVSGVLNNTRSAETKSNDQKVDTSEVTITRTDVRDESGETPTKEQPGV